MLLPKRKIRNRKFHYEPRFYDPKREEDLKNRMRIKRTSYSKRRSTRLTVFISMGILLLIAFYIYVNLPSVQG
ncbi:MAG: hypothetical protein AAF752_15435 [Bacteroidota bacterium]